MQKKTKITIIISAIILLIFIGSGVTYFIKCNNSENKKTADNTASSTDTNINNTEIASIDNSETSENTSTTTEANTEFSTSEETTTENNTSNKDDTTESNNENKDNTTENNNKPNNSDTTTEANKPQNTTQPTTEEDKPTAPTTTEANNTTETNSSTEESTTTEEQKNNSDETEKAECNHNWVQQYLTKHHPAEYEEQQVCVQEAYDEPIYEYHDFCNGCGTDLTILFPDGDYITHIVVCQGGSNYHAEKTIIGYNHHDVVYETQLVCVKEAYDEQVPNGYKCSVCGATK